MQKISYGKILVVVEDEDPPRRFIVINLKRNGFKVFEASSVN